MIVNTAILTTCDFWRENTTRKHDQRCSACRGLFDKWSTACALYTAYTSETI